MVKSVGFSQNIQINKQLAFKSQQGDSSVTNPIETTNLSGMDALAAYNSALINKNDKFNIPTIKPVQMPTNINSIDGERIYNSKGVLECVVKDVGDKEYIYKELEGSELRLFVRDKQTGNIELEQGGYTDEEKHVHTWIWTFDKDTGCKLAHNDYEDGKLIAKGATIYNNNGTRENVEFLPNEGTYIYSDENTTRNYDINKNLTFEYIYKKQNDGYIERKTDYANGKPITVKKNEVHGISNNEYQQYIQNPKLQRTPCPEFIDRIDNIEGQKTYYSNGQLESVRTPDGKLYEQSFDGKHINLSYENKTIEFENYADDNRRNCYINEDFGNSTKRTAYFDVDRNLEGNVAYTEGNHTEFVYFDENGKPVSYEKSDDSKEDYRERMILGIDYAPNGSVIDVYHSYEERNQS